MISNEILKSENKVRRHSYVTMFLHWSLVLMVFGSFITIGMKHSTVGLIPHIVGGCLAGAVGVAHLIYHYIIRGGSPIFPRKGDIKASLQLMKATFTGEKEPPSGKYLPEQRLAYIYVLVCVFLVVVTGLFRAVGGVNRQGLSFVIGRLHGPAIGLLMLGVFAHLGAFVIKANRPLIISMFKGKVDLKYAQKRHELWYAEIEKKRSPKE